MRVVVLGASGNVGTSVLRSLAADDRVDEIVGVARRLPGIEVPKTAWAAADIARDELTSLFRGADAVVHLAWLIQPSRDESVTERTNVHGTQRVLDAVAAAHVPALVYASSVGAYAYGPKDRRVDESWSTAGIPTSFYSRHKARTERQLDAFESARPDVRVVRLRPGLIFRRDAASGIRRLFAGPFLPSPLLRSELIPLVPDLPRLRFQAVHSLDVAEAYRLAVVDEAARGAFNVAAEPILDPAELGRLLGARPVRMPVTAVRALTTATWKLRLQPTPPGWLDMALGVPLMDTTRARTELGWEPVRSSGEALLELIGGMRDRTGTDTPPLDPSTGGPGRVREVITGIGGTSR
jgi:UDP-glucose 4-epimerase